MAATTGYELPLRDRTVLCILREFGPLTEPELIRRYLQLVVGAWTLPDGARLPTLHREDVLLAVSALKRRGLVQETGRVRDVDAELAAGG